MLPCSLREIFTRNQKPYLTSLGDWPPEEAARAKKKKLKLEPPEEDKREETQRPETQEKSGGWLWLQGKNSNLISPATAGCGLRIWLRSCFLVNGRCWVHNPKGQEHPRVLVRPPRLRCDVSSRSAFTQGARGRDIAKFAVKIQLKSDKSDKNSIPRERRHHFGVALLLRPHQRR